MDFNEYQRWTKKTDQYHAIRLKKKFNQFLILATLGLTGEAGEFADKIKKMYRNKSGVMDEATRQDLLLELGDVLWYLTMISAELGSSLAGVAKANQKKLNSRVKRGVIKSAGDHR